MIAEKILRDRIVMIDVSLVDPFSRPDRHPRFSLALLYRFSALSAHSIGTIVSRLALFPWRSLSDNLTLTFSYLKPSA